MSNSFFNFFFCSSLEMIVLKKIVLTASRLYYQYIEWYNNCVYLVVFMGGRLYILDLAAKIDQCAEYLCKSLWGDLEFPPPFGRDALPEVSFVWSHIVSLKIHYKIATYFILNILFLLPLY